MTCRSADDCLRTLTPVDLTSSGRPGVGERDPVLHVDGGDVGIGADGEGDGQPVGAVGAARRLHVEHVVDADDAALDRLRDGGLDHVGAGARVGRR